MSAEAKRGAGVTMGTSGDDEAAVEILRNAVVGRLVAAVAHELNNPVHLVAGNVDFLAQYLAALLELAAAVDAGADQARLAALKEKIDYAYLKKDAPRVVAAVREAATRLAALVKDLRTFTRASGAQQKIDLAAVVDSALNVLGPLYRKRLVVEREVEPGLPSLTSPEGHLHQAVLALLAAVAEAAPSGTVKILLSPYHDARGSGLRLEVRAHLTRTVLDEFSRRILAGHGAILEERLGDEGGIVVTLPDRAGQGE